MIALRLEGVAARLGGRVVLRDVDLEVPDGMRLGIIGVNGAGKTTLLRVLAGVLTPSAGRALIGDVGREAVAGAGTAPPVGDGTAVIGEAGTAVPAGTDATATFSATPAATADAGTVAASGGPGGGFGVAGRGGPLASEGLVDLRRMPARERARRLAFVPQEDIVTADLRVGEMVALGRVPQTRPWARGGRAEQDLVRDALDAVGLAGRIDTACDQLSGGERRRAVLARGLVQRCPVMLLDEPTNHLDVAWQLGLLDVLAAQSRTLVATVHDLDLALRFFDRLAVVGWHPGADRATEPATVVAVGPPAEVLSSAHLESHFGVGSVQVPHPTRPQLHLLIHPREDAPPT
ncbi:ABC transporter ATP-binding protein [Catenuloplanes indicus]|uniref:ABC-type cobalamin/Fe3+-siderophores transport system ATPase subunit n=1 Tax=Catenuloplanes indicus TaxID=137267 RepID=A0AAE4AVC3_9ACTN|nr:ABC transporter ATP-binding protein [Catenuloplanes indicus]MDQ0363827.1 ABC-type cobalamin/Fe3+-siderophores transport system ATPase subunit [Catenuloplanes indicus]